MNACFALVALAGAALAAEPPQLTNGYRSLSTDVIGHVYYNAATGEMIRTPGAAPRDSGSPLWINTLLDQCQTNSLWYFPLTDSASAESPIHWLDWGDIRPNSVIDCVTLFYVTDVVDPEGDGEAGYSMGVTFIDGFDPSMDAICGVVPTLNWTLDGIPGAHSGTTAWLLTIDLSDAPGDQFVLGAGQNDWDNDGKGDFGYAFHFEHPVGLTEGASRIGLVVPPERTHPNTLGDEDVFAVWLPDSNDVEGYYWFGGYNCDPGEGADPRPWASAFIGLFGSPPLCPPDRNADGALDFFDVQDYLGDFAARDPSADMNDDAAFDFYDVQAYLASFSAGCP